ncbi:Uncharacterised protein [Mycobacteroides abscessus subsp. abscessus]|nr:Uncharacterised protein [Mycobacteroides abscessus subsp. abscessus]
MVLARRVPRGALGGLAVARQGLGPVHRLLAGKARNLPLPPWALRTAGHPGVARIRGGTLGGGGGRRGDPHAETFHLRAEPAAEGTQNGFAQIALDGLLGQRRGHRQQREALRDGDRLDEFEPCLLCSGDRGNAPVGRSCGELGNHLGPHGGQHVLLVVHAVSSPESRSIGADGRGTRASARMGYPVIPRTSVAGSDAARITPVPGAAAWHRRPYEYATPGVFPHNYPQMWKTLGKSETTVDSAWIGRRPGILRQTIGKRGRRRRSPPGRGVDELTRRGRPVTAPTTARRQQPGRSERVRAPGARFDPF